MIKSIHIVNFKSIAAATLQLGQFNCLVGLNGAGKSTVLQVFDFLSHLMRGDVEAWLQERNWQASDLNNKLRKESNISLVVTYQIEEGHRLIWRGDFNRSMLRCTKEWVDEVWSGDAGNLRHKLFRAEGSSYLFDGEPRCEVAFTYQGSLLSVLKDSELPAPLLAFRDAMRRIRSLALLAPQLLRKRARSTDLDIGMGGEKLSAFLGNIKGQNKANLLTLLQRFYPSVVDFKVTSMVSGWKKLSVTEQFGGQTLETEATHLNDGLLRVLAVLAQSSSHRSLILLDEIENGINQELVEALVDTLVASEQQLVVTTHSPLILNYLEDDVARQAVQLVYKSADGETRLRRFFDIPRISAKLNAMGPGDAFVDTDLWLLVQECLALDQEEAQGTLSQFWTEATAQKVTKA